MKKNHWMIDGGPSCRPETTQQCGSLVYSLLLPDGG